MRTLSINELSLVSGGDSAASASVVGVAGAVGGTVGSATGSVVGGYVGGVVGSVFWTTRRHCGSCCRSLRREIFRRCHWSWFGWILFH